MTKPTLRHYPRVAPDAAPLRAVLEEGPTPVFVADRAIIEDRFRRLKQALQTAWPEHIIAYSFKTNYDVARSCTLQSLGAWAEVVSAREYQMARALGYPGRRIVFNGPFKPDDALSSALREGALLHVNDHDELTRLIALTQGARRRHRIGIRVRGPVPGLPPSRFGFSVENDEARDAVARILESRSLALSSVHLHLLGDTDDPECYLAAARIVGEFLAAHVPDYRKTIRHLDLGGAFPAHTPKPRSKEHFEPRPVNAYVRAIASGLRPFFPREPRPTLVLEPGRYLVGDGIIMVSRVVSAQQAASGQRAISDACITMVPLTHYAPQLVRAYDGELKPRGGPEVPTIVHGASCREDDALYTGPMPELRVGDYLVHFAVGAYNQNLSPEFIFDRPRFMTL